MCFGGVQDAPYVTLHNRSIDNCVAAKPELPATDYVYDEYVTPATGDAKTQMHPVGTVLMYPRYAVPPQRKPVAVLYVGAPAVNEGTYDTPWFIVFKPCPMSLLRGAVPVGRVVSCTPGFIARAVRNVKPVTPKTNESATTTQKKSEPGCEPSAAGGASGPFHNGLLEWFDRFCRMKMCSMLSKSSIIALAELDSPENRKARGDLVKENDTSLEDIARFELFRALG